MQKKVHTQIKNQTLYIFIFILVEFLRTTLLYMDLCYINYIAGMK